MKYILIMTFLLIFIAGCSALANSPGVKSASQAPEVPETFVVPDCGLNPIKVPKLPKVIPGYTELDRATGLHMTGTVQVIDFPKYRLKVTGAVEQPLNLHYDELRCLPKVTADPLLVCRGFL